jgi:predicted small lipoprotein YifL
MWPSLNGRYLRRSPQWHQQGESVMRISTSMIVAAGIVALAACNKKSPAENQASEIQANSENQAQNVTASGENEAANIMNSAENKASAVKNESKNEAAAIKNEGANEAAAVKNSASNATDNTAATKKK